MKINIYFTMVQDSSTQNVLLYHILVETAQIFFISILSKVKEEATLPLISYQGQLGSRISQGHAPSTITHSGLEVV